MRRHLTGFFFPLVLLAGGGIALVMAERQSLGTEYDGDSVGFWLERINTGGVTAGALFGFRW